MKSVSLIAAVLVVIPMIGLAQSQQTPPPQTPQNQSPQSQENMQNQQSQQSQENMQGQGSMHSRENMQAEEGQQSLSCIKDITYSQEFLERFPRAGAACRQVIQKDGQKWVRFDANVVRRSRNRVTATFIDTHDNPVGNLTIQASPEARVMVNGREMRYSLLKRGDKLSFWMPESRVGFYAEPGSLSSEQLALVDTGSRER